MIGVIRRARLGINSLEITSEVARQFPALPVDGGIIITQVEPGSPAALAGLRRGDILIRLDDTPIGGIGDLARFLRQRSPGDTISIIVIRDGRQITTEARLAESRFQ